MTEIRYYPLISCDSEGTEMVPMFPTNDPETIEAQSRMWLEEMVPHFFRLCCRSGICTNGITIRCPKCSKTLRAISEPINKTKQGLYVCSHCTDKAN